MNHHPVDEETVFHAALALRLPAERAAYLAAACGGDEALRRRVEDLLRSAQETKDFLEQPVLRPEDVAAALGGPPGSSPAEGTVATGSPAASEQPGDIISHYKLLEQIGEGGCGVVYMAEQQEPIRRRVALKVIKLGMDTKDVIARFEAERQALALMDHPNIAKVLDAGATATGRPYFVMELVRGIRITDYCDQNNLPTRARLELFMKVCQAIQHAHQKGVIHRDIKPSNILVTLHDGEPVPKVIDFGIAKATGQQRLTDKTLFTAFRQFIGTPAYMSPEQAEMTGLDIDTRSDIYSLGVLLYELLTGQTPFDAKELLAAGLDEMRRTIREKEPPTPSVRLTQALVADDVSRRQSAQGPGSAKNASADSRRRLQEIRGDLDWIVMRCLEKDRTRRYVTANGLAVDIQRSLNNEPIWASPPSRLYRLQKMAVRNKGTLAAVGAVAVALIAGLAASISLYLGQSKALNAVGREAEHARLAEADAREKLGQSYLAQAQAGRWSLRAGRRFGGLALLTKAASIRPSLELRNEAIACMALTDLRAIKEWEAYPQDGVFGNFDASYERYVFGDAQGTAHVCRVQDDAELAQFPGYEPPFHSLEFSRDGQWLSVASGRKHDRVEVWSLKRKEAILRLTTPNFRAMDFSADSRLVAFAYDRGPDNRDGFPVRIFDLALGKQVASFDHGSLPYYIRCHPVQPNLLLISDESEVVRVWDWTTGRVVQSFTHPDWVKGIDWHPTGEIVATACSDSNVRLWDAATGKERAVLSGHEWAAVDVTFSADGAFLVSRGWEGRLCLWDLHSQLELLSQPVHGFVHGFSRTGNRLGVAAVLGQMTLLDVVSGHGYRVLRSDLLPDERCMNCVFSPDGRLLVSTHDRCVRLWDVNVGKEIATIPKTRWAHFAVFDPNGTNLFLDTREGVENWSVERGLSSNHLALALRRRFDLIPETSGIHLSRDGRALAAAADGALQVLDATTGRKLARLKPPYGDVFSALNADGTLAATWTRSSTNVQIWDVPRSNVIHELSTHLSIGVAFSPDNRWIAVGDGTEVRTWDLQTWQSCYALHREAAGFFARLAFSPDSRLLAVAISRFSVRLVEAATGRELATLEAPDRKDIGWITFSDDGTKLAVAAGSGPIKLWDLRLIRQQLSTMKLDWDLAPLPLDGPKTPDAPLTVSVQQLLLPLRDPRCTPAQVDLACHYNCTFTNFALMTGLTGNDLAPVPIGLQTFAGTEFDVRGVVQLLGHRTSSITPAPDKVTAIRVDRTCRALHLLQACLFAVSSGAPAGATVGEYVVHYTDGRSDVVPLKLQENIADWWDHPSRTPKLGAATAVAWRGANATSRSAGYDIVLYKFRWLNPHPDTPIATLDFRSALGGPAPFLVAITAE